jgi:hypothetical protein
LIGIRKISYCEQTNTNDTFIIINSAKPFL